MNKRAVLSAVTLALIGLLAMAYGLTSAQGGPTPGAEPSAPAADTGNYFPVQGRLTDAGGNPLNGTFTITFTMYTVSSGGTGVCHDTNSVTVNNGLFSSEIWGTCTRDIVNGQQLYLGIKVGADPEMTPRQPMYSVPYAYTLRPGAIISSAISGEAVLHIENSGSAGRALRAYATYTTSVNYGVVGASRSPDGYGGYFYNNGGGVGLWGYSTGLDHPALYGCVAATSSGCDAGTNPAGVRGTSTEGDGVMGVTSHATYRGVYAENSAAGIAFAAFNNAADTTNHDVPTAYLVQANANGDFIVGASSYLSESQKVL